MTAEASLSSRFRRAASFVPSGVAVLHAADARMTVSRLQCVSFDPPWVSVALAPASRKAAVILAAGSFTARVLRHGEEGAAQGDEIRWRRYSRTPEETVSGDEKRLSGSLPEPTRSLKRRVGDLTGTSPCRAEGARGTCGGLGVRRARPESTAPFPVS